MNAISTATIGAMSVRWPIGLSVLMIVAGLLAIAVPGATGIAVSVLVGWMLIFSAGAHLVFAWHTRSAGGTFWELLLGILYFLVGAYVLVHPVVGLASLTLALASIYLSKASWNLSYHSDCAQCLVQVGCYSMESSP
jgi:uncharacterized membrane protein HdeD (DUF308 family)